MLRCNGLLMCFTMSWFLFYVLEMGVEISFFFLISKREETVLKRDAKIATQNIQKRSTPSPARTKNSCQKWRTQKNHPYQDPTQSMKPTKVKRPSFILIKPLDALTRPLTHPFCYLFIYLFVFFFLIGK